MVSYHRMYMFGEITKGEMQLNNLGEIVMQTWEWLPEQYPYVQLGPYIVMPNHFHGILQIIELDGDRRGGSRPAPPTVIKPLGQLIGAFKTVASKRINQIRNTMGEPLWQRNYYEHIIRNAIELSAITKYILSNPENWTSDSENVH